MTKAKLIKLKKKDCIQTAIFVGVENGKVYNFCINKYYYRNLEVNSYYYLLTEEDYEENRFKIFGTIIPWEFDEIVTAKLVSFRNWNYKEYDCTKRDFKCHICAKRELTNFVPSKKTSGRNFNYRTGIDYMEEINKVGFINGTTL